MHVTFIRHGESTGNAGIPCSDLALIELTPLGWRQAEEVAAAWTHAPDRIVTSPYVRTRQTAQPTIARFPSVPVEVWPVQEFTYLQPSRWNGTLYKDRKPYIDAYWSAADPDYCDGPGAESFATLLDRVRQALRRLEAQPENSRIFVFSHGQFIQAVRILILHPDCTAAEQMRLFWRKDGMPSVGNCELVETQWDGAHWQCDPLACVR